jgi:phage major head subunit gpT-like protein
MRLAGLNAAFMEAYGAYGTPWRDASLFVPSTQRTENYAWLGDSPQMSQWTDELVPKGLSEFTYTLANQRHAAAMEIFEDDLNDDLYGQTKIRIAEMADKAAEYPSILLRNLLTTNGTCYDGQAFFSTTHSEGSSGNQSNLVTGTGVTVAALQTDLGTARKLMNKYVTDTGDVRVRSNPKWVIRCAPDLEVVMLQAFMAVTTTTGGENIYRGLVSKIEVDQGLTGNDWYLEDRAPRIKAFILQERDAVEPKQTMPGSDTDVVRDSTIFRVKWRGNAGYGMWQNCCKIDN